MRIKTTIRFTNSKRNFSDAEAGNIRYAILFSFDRKAGNERLV
jgi:hypothetical protein